MLWLLQYEEREKNYIGQYQVAWLGTFLILLEFLNTAVAIDFPSSPLPCDGLIDREPIDGSAT